MRALFENVKLAGLFLSDEYVASCRVELDVNIQSILHKAKRNNCSTSIDVRSQFECERHVVDLSRAVANFEPNILSVGRRID